jgi:hypothetical protein
MIEIELLLTTCDITSITKLTQPVVARSDVCILFSGPLRPSLHTTPHTGLRQGQGLCNPLCYPLLADPGATCSPLDQNTGEARRRDRVCFPGVFQ